VPINKLSYQDIESIRLIGNEFLDWWSQIIATDDSRELLSVFSTISSSAVDKIVGGSALGWASRFCEYDFRWKFSVSTRSARLLRWSESSGKPQDELTSDEQKRDVLGAYRSIRRYLLKTHLKAHLQCIKCLSRIDRNEAMCLDGSVVCVPALAYLAWRMSVEELKEIGDIRRPKPNGISLRVQGTHESIATGEKPYWYFLRFFVIWDQLEFLVKTRKLRLAIRESNFHDIDFDSEAERLTCGQHWAIVPCVEALENASKYHAQNKESKEKNFIDLITYNTYVGWRIPMNREVDGEVIFQLRPCANVLRSEGFEYFYL
jgi:hypothetical protein